jgi:hypothetical protein
MATQRKESIEWKSVSRKAYDYVGHYRYTYIYVYTQKSLLRGISGTWNPQIFKKYIFPKEIIYQNAKAFVQQSINCQVFLLSKRTYSN